MLPLKPTHASWEACGDEPAGGSVFWVETHSQQAGQCRVEGKADEQNTQDRQRPPDALWSPCSEGTLPQGGGLPPPPATERVRPNVKQSSGQNPTQRHQRPRQEAGRGAALPGAAGGQQASSPDTPTGGFRKRGGGQPQDLLHDHQTFPEPLGLGHGRAGLTWAQSRPGLPGQPAQVAPPCWRGGWGMRTDGHSSHACTWRAPGMEPSPHWTSSFPLGALPPPQG